MKKLLATLLVLSMMLLGCSSGGSSGTPELALITDSGGVNDKSFNQSAWEAVKEYGEANGIGYKYYKPTTYDYAGYSEQIKNAVDNGAKVVALPGFNFAAAIGVLQKDYPDVNFILIDATPTDEEGNAVDAEKNLYCALYKETQTGFLAGYAAVKEGYNELGFMGGMALPAVINFGYGYIQGADYAAKETGAKVKVKYTYTGTFSESPEIKTKATGWYNGGTQVIFSCGGGICNSIFAAAEDTDAKTIGVDSDQSSASETVITSAMKGVKATVAAQVAASYDGTFKGGVYTLDASGGYVGLPNDFSRFEHFTAEDYDAIFKKVADGSIKISDYNAAGGKAGNPTKSKLSLKNTTVSFE